MWKTPTTPPEPYVPGYEGLVEVGRGGMGVVYRGRRTANGTEVAVKLVLPESIWDDLARELFLREIENHKALNHTNVVRLLDHGLGREGQPFLVTPWCTGGSAADLVHKSGPLPVSDAVRLVEQVLAGLEYIHEALVPYVKLAAGGFGPGRGLVHRDLKPGNVLLDGPDDAKFALVADFGLSKVAELAGLSGVTATGDGPGGTFAFMPRRQVANYKYAKPEVDVWAAAGTLYYLLTRRTPRNFPDPNNPAAAVLYSAPVPIRDRRPDIPARLAEVIDEALDDDVAPHQSLRYRTAVELREALAQAMQAEPGGAVAGKTSVGIIPDAPPRVPPIVDRPGPSSRFGPYRVVRRLPEVSGQGVLYLCRDTADRLYAVKTLAPAAAHSPEARERFAREGRLMASLDHPNLVKYYPGELEDDQPYLAMEWLDGPTLERLVREVGCLSVPDASEVIRQAASGLSAIHDRGHTHRDVKPANLMLVRPHNVKVIDYGLATDPASDLTGSGIVGTPRWMAPEQRADASTVDPRADLYALGLTFLYLLGGKHPPYPAPSTAWSPLAEMCPGRTDLSRVLVSILEDLTAAELGDRTLEAGRLADLLGAFAKGHDLPHLLDRVEGHATAVSAGAVAGSPRLEVAFDVLVVDSDGEERHAAGRLPLAAGARIVVHAAPSRPAYLYLIWRSSDGTVQPLYPWQGGDWLSPGPADPVTDLRLPLSTTPDAALGTFTLGGRAGLETVVLLAADRPLPDRVVREELRSRLAAGFPTVVDLGYVPRRDRMYWLIVRPEEVTQGTRSLELDNRPVENPVYQVHQRLRERLARTAGYLQAQTFVNQGDGS
jgi:serine/threonine protein kinase